MLQLEADKMIQPVQYLPPRVPIPLKEKIMGTIKQMERVASVKFQNPKIGSGSMVTIEKPVMFHICIDISNLNTELNKLATK